jgi:hypothetical protein
MQHRQDRTARALVTVLLALLCSGCEAQVRAPVNVATRLYTDCLNSKLMTSEIEPTRVGINEFVEAADDWCLTWTVIWYPALMGPQITELQPDVIKRINENRLKILQGLTNDLRKQALR